MDSNKFQKLIQSARNYIQDTPDHNILYFFLFDVLNRTLVECDVQMEELLILVTKILSAPTLQPYSNPYFGNIVYSHIERVGYSVFHYIPF